MGKYALVLCIMIFVLASGTFADDYVMFNYQGRVKVQGQLFDGSGQFKFSIVNNAGSTTLWSNDMTGTGGNEPDSYITVPVNEGIFNVTVGDPALGMEPINRTVFNHPNHIKLRIWFSDGSLGFQQLLPDRKLHNVDLMGMVSGEEDFTIYVNGATGNDENNGLTTETAKKTIQSAIDVLPSKIKCNVTIDIADGVYRESFSIVDINMVSDSKLTVKGDEGWTPSMGGEPSVRITGNDDDVSATRIRSNCMTISKSTRVTVDGILFDGASFSAVNVSSGSNGCVISDCIAKNSYRGFSNSSNSRAIYMNCVSEYNDYYGFLVIYSTYCQLHSCEGTHNGATAVYIQHGSSVDLFDSGVFSNNAEAGIMVERNSFCFFRDGYSGLIQNNTQYGIHIEFDSFTIDHTKNTISGNGTNLSTNQGGHTYIW